MVYVSMLYPYPISIMVELKLIRAYISIHFKFSFEPSQKLNCKHGIIPAFQRCPPFFNLCHLRTKLGRRTKRECEIIESFRAQDNDPTAIAL